jgi:hypothetical protein
LSQPQAAKGLRLDREEWEQKRQLKPEERGFRGHYIEMEESFDSDVVET